jgi:DNA (cytosine-5)-methyltransferase 1
MINGLDLFSGIGGISFALKEWVRPIAYCEIDPYCQGVLLSRMAAGNVEYAPIWDDIGTLRGSYLHETIDIIYGGFPCQDISIAGNGKGLEGKRSGLFFEIMRLAKEIKPKFIFLENVPAITSRGGLRVVREITEMGYDCRWCVISAASIGAKHKRERWFLLANSKSERLQERGQSIGTEKGKPRLEIHTEYSQQYKEPENKLIMAGMVDDVPYRLDRIKSLGNAVVPEQAKEAFKILMGIKNKHI